MRIRLISLAIILLAALALAPGAWAAPTTFTVNASTDEADANVGNGSCATSGGDCTLRAAIQETNAVAPGGDPVRIAFSVTSVVPISDLPAIRRGGTLVSGCNVDFVSQNGGYATPAPATGQCVGLIGAGTATVGLQVGDASSDPSGVAIFNLAFTHFPSAGIRVWGGDLTRISGNVFGRTLSGTPDPNGTAIRVSGRTQNGTLANPATGNVIGGPSSATDTDAPGCDSYCNTIVNSTQQGIDLVGTAAPSGPGDAPAGADTDLGDGTSITGNWIGVHDVAGTPGSGNETAVRIGDSLNTTFGTSPYSGGNVIAGNTRGVDQGTGTTSVTILGGVFGLSPSGNATRGNGPWNARLGGSDTFGGGAFVQGATFGPAETGLELVGPRPNVLSSVFMSPDSARFTKAAIHVAPGGDGATIGTDDAAPFLPGCVQLIDTCNTIGYTAADAPGIWIDGADNTRIQRNLIGETYAPPVPGPPIRIDGGASGSVVGDDDIGPDARNMLTRLTGPAIEVGEGATGVVIGDNLGLAQNAFDLPTGLFTDLLPVAGPGNDGTANNGIQPPSITVSSTTGIGGLGIPGATIRILAQQRPLVLADPDPNPEGTTFPTTPSSATVGEDGIWGVTFQDPLKSGVKLLASQTTADGSSEYAPPLPASDTNTPPIITFQSGPSGVVESRSATFTFSSNKPGTRLTCSVDAGAFVPCSSPFTLNGLDIGGHQLQVKGTDPTGKPGAPASRTWIVQIPEPVNPGGGGTPATGATAGTIRFSSVVSLPSAGRCVSRRTLRITVRTPKGAKVKSAEVRIGNRKVGSSRKAKTIPVSLKGLGSGRFVVRVKVTLTDGRVISGSRTYRTCAKKKAKKR